MPKELNAEERYLTLTNVAFFWYTLTHMHTLVRLWYLVYFGFQRLCEWKLKKPDFVIGTVITHELCFKTQ